MTLCARSICASSNFVVNPVLNTKVTKKNRSGDVAMDAVLEEWDVVAVDETDALFSQLETGVTPGVLQRSSRPELTRDLLPLQLFVPPFSSSCPW